MADVTTHQRVLQLMSGQPGRAATGSHRVVVIGGGFGGLRATLALRDAPVEITLIDRRNFHLFQPLLYQVATGSLALGEIAAPLRGVLRHQKNAHVILAEVAGFDLDRRCVILDRTASGSGDVEVPYDSLIVAAGARHSYFGHDDWEAAAPGLKSIEDALEIRRRILLAFEAAEVEHDPVVRQEWLTFVVVGAGPTGVELAGQIAEIARDTLPSNFRAFNPAETRVYLVEGADRVLLSFTPEYSEKARATLAEMGVTVLLNKLVTDVQPGMVTTRSNDGGVRPIAARTVVWAAGVQATPLAAELATKSGADIDAAGRLMVQPDLSLPGRPEVFVIGDMARLDNPATGRPLPGVAPVAMQQGRHAARAITARLEGRAFPAFRYKEKGNLATIGRAKAVAELPYLKTSGFVAWVLWIVVHIAYLIGFQNRLLVITRWAFSFFTHGRGARLITAGVRGSALPERTFEGEGATLETTADPRA
jgi:NADH dehydrogenase